MSQKRVWVNKRGGFLQPTEPGGNINTEPGCAPDLHQQSYRSAFPARQEKNKRRFSPAVCLAQVPSATGSSPPQPPYPGSRQELHLHVPWPGSHKAMAQWKEVVLFVPSGLGAVGAKLRESAKPQALPLQDSGWTGLWVTYNLKTQTKNLKTSHIYSDSCVILCSFHWFTQQLELPSPSAKATVSPGYYDRFLHHILDLQLIKEKCIQRSLILAEPGQSWWAGRLDTGVTPGWHQGGHWVGSGGARLEEEFTTNTYFISSLWKRTDFTWFTEKSVNFNNCSHLSGHP